MPWKEAGTLFELAQEEQALGSGGGDSGGGAGAAARWGAHAAASCIYESIPGHRCTPELRSSYEAYRRHRCTWPLRPGVWRLLFASRLSRLVAELLGPAAVLFNDQVGRAHVGITRQRWMLSDCLPGGPATLPALPRRARWLRHLCPPAHLPPRPPAPIPQYILKPPCSSLSAFAWHRDSDWLRTAGVATRQPYLSGARRSLLAAGPGGRQLRHALPGGPLHLLVHLSRLCHLTKQCGVH